MVEGEKYIPVIHIYIYNIYISSSYYLDFRLMWYNRNWEMWFSFFSFGKSWLYSLVQSNIFNLNCTTILSIYTVKTSNSAQPPFCLYCFNNEFTKKQHWTPCTYLLLFVEWEAWERKSPNTVNVRMVLMDWFWKKNWAMLQQ